MFCDKSGVIYKLLRIFGTEDETENNKALREFLSTYAKQIDEIVEKKEDEFKRIYTKIIEQEDESIKTTETEKVI